MVVLANFDLPQLIDELEHVRIQMSHLSKSSLELILNHLIIQLVLKNFNLLPILLQVHLREPQMPCFLSQSLPINWIGTDHLPLINLSQIPTPNDFPECTSRSLLHYLPLLLDPIHHDLHDRHLILPILRMVSVRLMRHFM